MKERYQHLEAYQAWVDTCDTCADLKNDFKWIRKSKEKPIRFQNQLPKGSMRWNCTAIGQPVISPLQYLTTNKTFYNRKTWFYSLGANTTELYVCKGGKYCKM